MENNRRNTGALVGGVILVTLGALTLLEQIFKGTNFWETFWPFIVMGVGGMFFVGMFAGGKSVSGLAIPGAIITAIGLMLFVQNLSDHFESWAYGWTVIIVAVGAGISIMGWFGGDASQRAAGLRVMKVGAILFLIFGAFFEMLFNSWSFSRFIFPVALIALGVYLILARTGLLPKKNHNNLQE